MDHCRACCGQSNHSDPRLTNGPVMIDCDLEASGTVDVHDRDEVMHLMGDVDDSARATGPVRMGWMLLNRQDLYMVAVTALGSVMLGLIQCPSLVHLY